MNAPTTLMGNPIKITTPTSGAASWSKHTNLGIDQQRLFMKSLNLKSPGFTAQTFADNKSARDPSLTRVILSPTHDTLLQFHALGAGIFVAVNETDGKGRKSENITRIRAVWQEDDDGFDSAFPLRPSMVIETSPGHFHRYWLVADEWPADELGRADFAAVMERMVESYGSDKNAKDISRVLRLPGFLHRKGKTPHLVRIVEASGHRYSRAEIIAAFPPVERAKKTHTERTWTPQHDDIQRVRDALNSINADDRDLWLQCGMAIKDQFGDSGRSLWDDWSRQSDKYNERDQDRTWKSFRRNGISIGTLFYHAQQAGWRNERIHREPSNGAARDEADRNHACESSDLGTVWPTLDEGAYHGIVGDIVRTVSPHTEADPAAILIQVLTLAGNAIGRSPHYQVESSRHRANLFAVLVGDTSKARKGTSFERTREIVKVSDETWCGDRIKGGLSSGEGFINEVRDPVQKYNNKEQTYEVADPGVTDKRLMIVEPEFASAISVAERQGNTLSQNIRRAWDGNTLESLTKQSPLRATDPHISIIGHITFDELRARLSRTEMANGFANRFLYVLVKRSKELPFGGNLTDSEILHLGERLKGIVNKAKPIGRMDMSDDARAKWAAIYHDLSAPKPGLLGAVVARGEAQTVRLALNYALLDGADEIGLPHLEAALAVWEYCEASAIHIFGRAVGDPVADEILRALQQAGAAGMTRTDIRDLFARNKSSERIGIALQLLRTMGRAKPEPRATGGRPVEVWVASRA
jgi:hypothetical protein